MTITGHETAQIFRRYAGIVDPEEQKAAFSAREAFPIRHHIDTHGIGSPASSYNLLGFNRLIEATGVS